MKQLQVDVLGWLHNNKPLSEDDNGEYEPRIMLSVNVDNGKAVTRIGLLDQDSERIESLKTYLTEKGYTVITISDATWFMCGKDGASMDGITVNIGTHIFTFPMSATEEEIEKTINEWLAENKPEMKAEVDVEVTTVDDHKQVKIKIKLEKEA